MNFPSLLGYEDLIDLHSTFVSDQYLGMFVRKLAIHANVSFACDWHVTEMEHGLCFCVDGLSTTGKFISWAQFVESSTSN